MARSMNMSDSDAAEPKSPPLVTRKSGGVSFGKKSKVGGGKLSSQSSDLAQSLSRLRLKGALK